MPSCEHKWTNSKCFPFSSVYTQLQCLRYVLVIIFAFDLKGGRIRKFNGRLGKKTRGTPLTHDSAKTFSSICICRVVFLTSFLHANQPWRKTCYLQCVPFWRVWAINQKQRKLIQKSTVLVGDWSYVFWIIYAPSITRCKRFGKILHAFSSAAIYKQSPMQHVSIAVII